MRRSYAVGNEDIRNKRRANMAWLCGIFSSGEGWDISLLTVMRAWGWVYKG
jgi:hypothetical protein